MDILGYTSTTEINNITRVHEESVLTTPIQLKKSVTITLPGIKAVSRNQTTGHFYHYYSQLMLAEQWMWTYGKAHEYHFTVPVDVTITAYYKNTRRQVLKSGKIKEILIDCPDAPNIDDKIFTDILVRWKQQKKGSAIERKVWFIEDDNGDYLRSVHKYAIPSTEYKVVITITEAE